jgi:hypothetical protein
LIASASRSVSEVLFMPRQPALATGKSLEPAGWEACPTHSTATMGIAGPLDAALD